MYRLFEQQCVDDAILTRTAGNPGMSDLGLDNRSLGEKVSSDIVRVCRVLLRGLDFYLSGLAVLRVGHVCDACTQRTDFVVSAERPDNPCTVLTDMGVCRCKSDLSSPLHLGRAAPAPGYLPY